MPELAIVTTKIVASLVKSDVAAGATNTLRPLTHPLDLSKEGLSVDTTPESEEWRPIPGFEGYLEVSNQGRVRSVDRMTYVSRSRGGNPYWRRHAGRVLDQTTHPRGGYKYICLNGGGKVRNNAKVHHLVLEAFVGPRPEGMECCHANDIPDDNRLENLRWDTPRANVEDRVRIGKQRSTKHCPKGHEYTPENTMIVKRPRRARRCRICARDHGKATYARKMARQREARMA
ncbi:NUMOD4 motif-containing HNH endonuclease [Mycobacterium sp. TJFP1]